MDLKFLNDMRPFNMDDGVNLLKSGGMVTMSWGIHNLDALYVGDKDDCRGLIFEVQGHHFQGSVALTVNGLDYYEVRFFKDGELQEDMTMTDLFVGDMIEQIDRVVEYVPEYEDR
jgi:hypothetical protein